ncbi:unnamed protein product [Caenorhabditis bovis]|uniref:Runt domain-containing protein n=1 Tax=Caenorhabditis bovis TaxID=2654633 RepID=A0A8S1FC48_9PELO|nr:unnamed protein product [Caenorhabditis bovis]
MSGVLNHVRAFLDQQPVIAGKLEKSSSPNILYSQLPKHWRSNKSFPDQFVVLILTPVPDNTEVTIWAGNDEAPCGEIRNEKARVHRQVAKFNDLRFVGRSGRGRKFHITIVVHSTPMMVATVKNVIKVTVDGPREARQPKPATSGSRRSADNSYSLDITPPTIIPPIITPPHMWWAAFGAPQVLPPIFHPPVSTIFPTIPPMMSNPLKRHATTPLKSESSENSSLNDSESLNVSASPQTSFIVLKKDDDDEEEDRAEDDEDKKKDEPKSQIVSPSGPISLVQSTPDSLQAKRRRRQSATSSNGSSPTIWRPF